MPDIEDQWIEVFRAGDYPQGSISIEDLDDMVNSYNVRTFEAPVTKDHEQEGPAYGWVSAIKREGATLLTKFSQVSETLKNWIKTGAYKKRSAEIYKNFQGTGKKYLRAVSFLGATSEQVKGMKPIAFAEGAGSFAEIDYEPDLMDTMKDKKLHTQWEMVMEGLHDAAWHKLWSSDLSPEEKRKGLLGLFEQMKACMEKEEYSEMPKDDVKDEKKPDPATAVINFSEYQVKKMIEAAVASATVQLGEQLKIERLGREALEEKNRREEIRYFCDGLSTQGRAVGAWRDAGIEQFIFNLETGKGAAVLMFGEQKNLDPGSWFREFLKTFTPKVEMGENKAQTWKRLDTLDSPMSTIEAKVSAFREKNSGATYEDALIAVTSMDKNTAWAYLADLQK